MKIAFIDLDGTVVKRTTHYNGLVKYFNYNKSFEEYSNTPNINEYKDNELREMGYYETPEMYKTMHLYEDSIDFIDYLIGNGYKIVFLTGRPNNSYITTYNAIKDNFSIDDFELITTNYNWKGSFIKKYLETNESVKSIFIDDDIRYINEVERICNDICCIQRIPNESLIKLVKGVI